MPITTREMHFGEGIYDSGEKNPQFAYENNRNSIRQKRLRDAFPGSGSDERKFTISDIVKYIDTFNECIEAADKQVKLDNADFIKKHSIKTK